MTSGSAQRRLAIVPEPTRQEQPRPQQHQPLYVRSQVISQEFGNHIITETIIVVERNSSEARKIEIVQAGNTGNL